jgi:prepilin-type N-terminal cleavage/methylation domain-containing protein
MLKAISLRICRTKRQVGPRRARRAGYSLPEMMMVVAIAGMMLAVAAPNFVRFNARDRVATAGSDLQGVLGLARQAALSRRVTYRVTVLSDPTRIVVERRNGESWVADPAEPLPVHESVGLQTEFGGSPGNTDLLIDPQGMVRAEDAPAVFIFSNAHADTATVRMVRTGRIRLHVS